MPAVQISENCYKKLERIVQQSLQYDSVDALVDYVLKAIILDPDEQDKEISKAIEERLKSLGYL